MIRVEVISERVTRFVIIDGTNLSREIVTYDPKVSIWDLEILIDWLESDSQNWNQNFVAGLRN